MTAMKFECQVLTPLFLGGSNPRVAPELRAPSIRGAMRYWYRALLGGSTLTASSSITAELQAVKDHEARVFGTTERASAITVRVTHEVQPEIATFKRDRAIRTTNGDFLPTGKDYLLWSMAASGRPETPRYQPDREYIKPGTRFAIILEARRDEITQHEAAASFWLLANLGALGARSTRGAGSFQAQQTNSEKGSMEFRVCNSIDELQTWLAQGIRQCLAALGDGNGMWRTFQDNQTQYDIIAPTATEVWVTADSPSGWDSDLDALNGIGAKMRDYRSHRHKLGQTDHDAVLNWLEAGGTGPEIQRAAFGLSIPFRYSDGGPSDVIINQISDRRTSPLHIRVTRLATGKYVGVFTLFKSQFLESGKKLQLQTRKWQAPAPSNYRVIQDFIQTFDITRRVEL